MGLVLRNSRGSFILRRIGEETMNNHGKLFQKRNLGLIVNLTLAIIILLFAFKPQIMPIYYRIQFPSPIEFKDLKISFPKGIIFSKGKNNIVFFEWNNPMTVLFISKMDPLKMKKDSIIRFFRKKKFHVLETKDLVFKGYEAFEISYVDTDWIHNYDIYVVPKGLYLNYQGTRAHYGKFKKIINEIEFK